MLSGLCPETIGENFPYDFKGAQSAPGLAGCRAWQARQVTLSWERCSSRRSPARLSGDRCAPGRRLPLFGPAGPRRRRRATRPRGPLHWLGAATISARRASLQKRPSSRRFSLEPTKITVKSALACGLRVARDGLRPLLTVILVVT
jgi:hypothetical protein